MTSPRSVCITGIGVVSAVGHGADPFFVALAAGKTGIAPRKDGGDLTAAVRDFDARAWGNRTDRRRMDHLSRMIVAAGSMALADAGLDLPRYHAPERVALTVGTSPGNMSEMVDFLTKLHARGPALASPFLFPNLLLSAPASYASIEHGVTGPTLTISQGEISAELAVGVGCDLLAAGSADVVLAGGGDELAPIVATVYRDLGLTCGESATWRGPFDVRACGTVLGEGAAALVLERSDHAAAHGRRAYAEIIDHRTWSVPAPACGWPNDPEDTAAEIRLLGDGDLTHVDAIYCAASGVPDHDRAELRAVEAAMGNAGRPWMTSIKGAIGDFGAVGGLTLAAAALSVSAGVIIPVAGLVDPPVLAWAQLATESPRFVPLRQVLVTALARGGGGTALLLRRPDTPRAR